jgi:hypothetical protein
MSYNEFTLDLARDRFGLKIINRRFCNSLELVEPQQIILEILHQWFPVASTSRTEKAKSELLVSPVLLEARRLANTDTI